MCVCLMETLHTENQKTSSNMGNSPGDRIACVVLLAAVAVPHGAPAQRGPWADASGSPGQWLPMNLVYAALQPCHRGAPARLAAASASVFAAGLPYPRTGEARTCLAGVRGDPNLRSVRGGDPLWGSPSCLPLPGVHTSVMAGLLAPCPDQRMRDQRLRANHLVSKVSPTDESMETHGGPNPVLY